MTIRRNSKKAKEIISNIKTAEITEMDTKKITKEEAQRRIDLDNKRWKIQQVNENTFDFDYTSTLSIRITI